MSLLKPFCEAVTEGVAQRKERAVEKIELLLSFPLDGGRCVGIVNFRDVIYVATENRLYRLSDDGTRLQPVPIERIPDAAPSGASRR